MLLAQLGYQPLHQYRLVHRQHHGERVLDPQPVHRIAARGIAECGAETIALRALDQVGIRIERDIRLVMRGEHLRHQSPDAAGADNDHAWFVGGILG